MRVLLIFSCATFSSCVSKIVVPEFRRGWLPVGGGHEIYLEDTGPVHLPAAVYLHGGPGSGTNPRTPELFNPRSHRLITFDQRGSGRNRYVDPISNNTSDDLVRDLEALRKHLKIDRWAVVGGSWGSTLALLYAERHPQAVRSLVLWGIFLGTRSELPWLRKGAFPKRWQSFSGGHPDPAGDYHRRLEDPRTSEAERIRLARTWQAYEATFKVRDQSDESLKLGEAKGDLVRATRIKIAYLAKDSFLRKNLLADLDSVRSIPTMIIQGSADAICPADGAAARLRRAWPEARYIEVPGGGHSAFEGGMDAALRGAIERLP